MKLTLALLLVGAAVMLSEARPDEIRRVVEVSAMGEGVGEKTASLSDAYEDPTYGIRSGTAFSSAGNGISVSQSRIRTKEYQTDGVGPVDPASSGAAAGSPAVAAAGTSAGPAAAKSADTAAATSAGTAAAKSADTAAAKSADTAAPTSASTAAATSAGTVAATSSSDSTGTAAATTSRGSGGTSKITMMVA